VNEISTANLVAYLNIQSEKGRAQNKQEEP